MFSMAMPSRFAAFRRCYSVTSAHLIKRSDLAMTTNERVPNMPNDCSGYAFRRCYSVTSARLIKRSNLAMTTNEGEDIPADVQSDSGDDDDDEAEYVKYNAQKLIKQAEFYLNSSMQPGKKPDTAQASEKLYQACTKALMDYAFIIEKRGPAFIHHKRDNPWNYPLFVNFRNVLVRNQKFIGVENATNINDGWNAAYGLHTNGFRMNNLDPIQVKMDLPKVKSFVRTVEELGKMENSELEKEVREIFKERKSIAEKASKIEKEMQGEEFPLAMQTLVHTGNGNRKKLGKKYHQLTNKNLTVEFRKLFEKCFDGYMKDEK